MYYSVIIARKLYLSKYCCKNASYAADCSQNNILMLGSNLNHTSYDIKMYVYEQCILYNNLYGKRKLVVMVTS